MRTRTTSLIIVAAALFIAACHHSDQAGSSTHHDKATAGARGPDPILLRIPRTGGSVRAYLYPKLDSVIWTGSGTSISRVLGFDPDGGSLAIVDAKGAPARVDLRLGESAIASRARLASLAASNGGDMFGVDPKGGVLRMTRSGDWSYAPPSPARAVFPQQDGSLVIAAARGAETIVWRLHPPETRILDSAVLPISLRGGATVTRAQVGDRIYFGTDTGLVGIKARDLSIVPSVHFPDRVIAIAPTPSGDRIYVSTNAERGVSVIDRYTEQVSGEVSLPGLVADVRMDPLGRYVIVKPVRGDSAWVIAVATDRLVGTIATRWTADLPATAPDGAIAASTGRDVVFLDGETLQPVRTIVGGAEDYWYFMFWNGFRPRAAGLDQPVSFTRKDSTANTTAHDTATVDSALAATASASATVAGAAQHPAEQAPASANPPAPKEPPSTAPAPQKPARASPPKPQAFSVSFATLLSEEKAREIAETITVNGAKAHVVSAQRAGAMVYRVVLGPYPSHDAAQQAGIAAKRQFWVYPEGP